jgi:hypothetical protein
MQHVSTTAIVPFARKVYQGCRQAQAYWYTLPPERRAQVLRVLEERLDRRRPAIERRLGPKTSGRLDQFLLWARDSLAAG